jgi:hypothetical protein
MHRLKVLTLQHQYLFVKIPGRLPLAYFVQAHCLLKKDVYVRSRLQGWLWLYGGGGLRIHAFIQELAVQPRAKTPGYGVVESTYCAKAQQL